uniref:Glutamic acid-rich protein-like n=1 Tax=Nicotiana tabacum TaxID=4097 RepID=A0A1S3XR25_TOBAC|nr:PREDICTED: glutamic acid-rich protein-like [Nicotiana tabacum]
MLRFLSVIGEKRIISHQSLSVKKRTRSKSRLDEDIPVSKNFISRRLALEGVDDEKEEDLDINAAQTQMEEQVSEKIIVEEEKDSDDGALGVEDDENGVTAAQEVDKDAEEEKEEDVAEEEEEVAEEEEDDEEDDEQFEDVLESETNAAVEGDQDALSIPVFVRAIDVSKYIFKTFLRKHRRFLARISVRSKDQCIP